MSVYIILTFLFIDPELSKYTGGQRRYAEMVRCLERKGNTVHLIGYSVIPGVPIKGHFFRIPVLRLSKKAMPNAIVNCVKVLWKIIFNMKILKRLKIDLIVVNSVANALPALLTKMFLHVKVVTLIFSDPIEYREIQVRENGVRLFSGLYVKNKVAISIYLSLFRFFEKVVFKRSDLILVQSNAYKQLFSDRYGKDSVKIEGIFANINPYWIEKAFKNSNKSSSLKKICFVGNLTLRKGIIDLTRAIVILSAEFPEMTFHVVGDGIQKDELVNILQEAGVLNRARLYGWIINPMQVMAASDILVVPSHSDSFPEVIGESLFVGTPVLGARVGGIPEQLKYEKLLFNPGDVDEIAGRLRELLLSNDMYQRIKFLCGERARALTFNWGEAFQKVIDRLFLSDRHLLSGE